MPEFSLKNQGLPYVSLGPKESKNSVVSRVYTPTQNYDQDNFQSHLIELNVVIDDPWCLLGDFKELTSANEKKGGHIPTDNKYQRLNDFLAKINAKSIQVNGNILSRKKDSHPSDL